MSTFCCCRLIRVQHPFPLPVVTTVGLVSCNRSLLLLFLLSVSRSMAYNCGTLPVHLYVRKGSSGQSSINKFSMRSRRRIIANLYYCTCYLLSSAFKRFRLQLHYQYAFTVSINVNFLLNMCKSCVLTSYLRLKIKI